ncbi:MAG: hypothetical protein CMP93_05295 [Gammaproteobacteria bacterium]|nr:hypothetical protein [Gammaproteobacteria bacterium]
MLRIQPKETKLMKLFVIFFFAGLLNLSEGVADVMTSDKEWERFKECPPAPNCVSSETPSRARFIERFKTGDRPVESWNLLNRILEKTSNCRIISQDSSYIHAEFRTRLFRFVDDVEFRLESETSEIAVRSASRVGFSDLGTNRRRLERIRGELERLREQE